MYPLLVERQRARFSSWYEFFPRSASDDPKRHGTFADCEKWLPYVQKMGFDVLYFPPIHPIGRSRRKGRNNTLDAKPDDVGSPWAIGAAEGGHEAILERARHARRLEAADLTRQGPRHRDRARHRLPVRARPPLGQAAPGVVQEARRRQHPVRRESAEEVPGHLPVRLRDERLARPVGGAGRRVPVLGRTGRADLPRRQPAHQGLSVLGVGHRACAAALSRRDLPVRGLHPAARDAPPGQGRLQPVVHLLHLAQHQVRAHAVLHRAERRPGARLLPAQRLAEHARHHCRPRCSRASARSSCRAS